MVVSSDSSSNDLSLEQSGTQKWKVMLGIGLGAFLFGLDIYIVNLALPILVESLHTNFATIQWVVISYVLMITVFVLSAARLGDMYNKKWLYLGGIILFSISSLFCGLAPSVGFLIGFRALQGFGAVFISALGAAIITEVFPSTERGRALGIFSAIFVLGIALGPGVGGLLLSVGGWRLIFLVNVPVGLMASLIVAFAIPPSATKEEVDNSFKFDVIGALLLTVTLTCFALAMTLIQISNWAVSIEFILLAIAAISFVCFLVVESRLESPMLDLKLFRSPEFSLSLLLNCVAYVVIGALGLLLPFFLTLVKHYPPELAGVLLMVFPIFSALISPIAGTVSDRFGERIVTLIGLFLMVCGCWAVSTLNTSSTMLDLVIRAGLLQMGMGTFYSSNSSIVMGSVPQEQLGIGSGLLSFSRIGGTMIGVSLLGALFSTLTSDRAVKILLVTTGHIDVSDAPSEALVFSLDATFAITAVIVLVATILTAILWRQSLFGNSSEIKIQTPS